MFIKGGLYGCGISSEDSIWEEEQNAIDMAEDDDTTWESPSKGW